MQKWEANGLTPQQAENVERAIEHIVPVAKDMYNIAMSSAEHGQNGWIYIWKTLLSVERSKRNVVIMALLRCGYPKDTMAYIVKFIGEEQ